MKGIVLLLVCGFVGVALGQDAITFTNKVVTFTNLQAHVYREVQLVRADMDGIIYRETVGVGGGRVYYTNLSAGVLESLGIPTNRVASAKPRAEPKSIAPKTNAVDLVLAGYRDSDLEVVKHVNSHEKLDSRYFRPRELCLKAKEFCFSWSEWSRGKDSRCVGWGNLVFKYGQEEFARRLFGKFLEWEAVAATNHAQPFKKVICSYPDVDPLFAFRSDRTFTFQWNVEAYRGPERPVGFAVLYDTRALSGHGGEKNDVVHFLDLLNDIPALKEELAKKICNRETEKSLFR